MRYNDLVDLTTEGTLCYQFQTQSKISMFFCSNHAIGKGIHQILTNRIYQGFFLSDIFKLTWTILITKSTKILGDSCDNQEGNLRLVAKRQTFPLLSEFPLSVLKLHVISFPP